MVSAGNPCAELESRPGLIAGRTIPHPDTVWRWVPGEHAHTQSCLCTHTHPHTNCLYFSLACLLTLSSFVSLSGEKCRTRVNSYPASLAFLYSFFLSTTCHPILQIFTVVKGDDSILWMFSVFQSDPPNKCVQLKPYLAYSSLPHAELLHTDLHDNTAYKKFFWFISFQIAKNESVQLC